ncbi:MAG: tRNA pseudouridine(38-40) synthase TruA [Armatimonadetes bacterium]|nr:tRNA pseudouridine(38-40) synthase TruA [Armatimonadota bacterium]
MTRAERFPGTLPWSEERDAEGRRNIAVLLAYDGTGFLGFQRQAQTPTIQQVVEDGLERLLKHPVRITPAGRTDAGVHACGQVFNFRTGARIPTARVPAALNSVLPPTVVAQGAASVPPDFSARRSARGRVYYYLMAMAPYPSPFTRRFSWHYPWPLDVAAMNEAARALRGTHDFRSFCVDAAAQRSTVREVFWVRCRLRRDMLVTVVRANAFLRGMVRAIVGTLVDVGRGKLAPESVAGILAARDRAAAGAAAPPGGLCLARVDY